MTLFSYLLIYHKIEKLQSFSIKNTCFYKDKIFTSPYYYLPILYFDTCLTTDC